MDRPIPALYTVYLLRSAARPSSLYVGSTPDPARRLRQHNGDRRGGAARTARERLRPWDMAVVVDGFPSRIAALQFEWAWQNPHLTRHIPPAQRITPSANPPNAHHRRRPARPRSSLPATLANLRLLLASPSFRRWPLTVRLLVASARDAWAAASAAGASVGPAGPHGEGEGVEEPSWPRVEVDLVDGVPDRGRAEGRGVFALRAGFGDVERGVLGKSFGALVRAAKGEELCAVCGDEVVDGRELAVVCSCKGCEAVSHAVCLAGKFLGDESGGEGKGIVPRSGRCPKCDGRVEWSAVARDMSLRSRGSEVIEKLMKAGRRRREATATADGSPVVGAGEEVQTAEVIDILDESDDEEGDVSLVALSGERDADNWLNPDDDWRYVEDDGGIYDDEDHVFEGPDEADMPDMGKISDDFDDFTKDGGRVEIVIPDSEIEELDSMASLPSP